MTGTCSRRSAPGDSACTRRRAADIAAVHPVGSQGPDAFLVDIRAAGALPRDLPALRRQFPATGIVVVAATLDPGGMLDAMRLGITEWLPEPLAAADLDAALQRVSRPSTTPAGARPIVRDRRRQGRGRLHDHRRQPGGGDPQRDPRRDAAARSAPGARRHLGLPRRRTALHRARRAREHPSSRRHLLQGPGHADAVRASTCSPRPTVRCSGRSTCCGCRRCSSS